MSYILEALKKSDEERNRGTAPGLQTVQMATVVHPSKKRRGWLCLLALALLLNAGLLIWWLGPWRSADQHTVQSSEQQPPQAVAVQTAKVVEGHPPGAAGAGAHTVEPGVRPSHRAGAEPQPAPAAQSKPAAVVGPPAERGGKTSAPAAVATAPAQQPTRPAVKEPPAGVREAKSAPAVEPSKEKDPKPLAAVPTKPVAKAEAIAPAPPSPAIQQQAKATAEAPPNKPEAAKVEAAPADAETVQKQLPNIQGLPPGMRKEIPAITLSLLVYSNNPADRMVNINGQMTREGQEIVPGLVLEQITKEGAVFNYKGTRFQKGAF